MRLIAETRARRIAYAVAAVVLAILCIFPRPYVARAKLLPQDSTSAGIGALLNSVGSQAPGLGNLLTGGRPANDLYLVVARSNSATESAIRGLHLVGSGSGQYDTVDAAKRALSKKVDVHLLLGGVLEVETWTDDPRESLRLTQGFVNAISNELGSIGTQNIKRKRQIVDRRRSLASDQASSAEAALNSFRSKNAISTPDAEISSAIGLRTGLEGELQGRLSSRAGLREILGPDNSELQKLDKEIAGLRQQIASTANPTRGSAGPNISGVTGLDTQYLNLYHDYRFAQVIYDAYARASEQVAVEELASQTASYVEVIDEPNLDTDFRLNVTPLALLGCMLLLFFFTDFYVGATGMHIPLLNTTRLDTPVPTPEVP